MDTRSAAVEAVWQRGLPVLRQRLHLLERTARALSDTRSIDAEDRTAALDVAHKLAGSLGMFGYLEATEQARAVEETLDVEGLPQPERLQQHVDSLLALLEPAMAD